MLNMSLISFGKVSQGLLLLLVVAASALEMPSADFGEDFLEKMNKRRLELCQEVAGERSMAVHIFNLTNPEEFQQKKIPDFNQLGPFVFKETRTKADCSVTIGNLDVTFEISRAKQLIDTQVVQDLELPLTTANVAFHRFVRFVEDVDSSASLNLMKFFSAGEGYIRKETSIKGFLLDGFDTSMANAYLRRTYPSNLLELQKDKFTPLDELLYPQEMTLHSDPENIGHIYRIDGKNLEITESCKPVNGGTEGTIFPSGLTESTLLHFYSEDLCQIIPLKFEQREDYEGISAFRFVFSDDALDKAACDCNSSAKYKDDVKNCFPPGGIDVKTCQKNLPFVVSLPHFLQADPKYTAAVSGMAADEALHQSYFIIEPVTGHVLESSFKFQLNVNLLKFEEESFFWLDGDVRIVDTIYPYVWTDKKFTLAKEIVSAIKSYLKDLNKSTTEAPATVTFENTATPEVTTQTPEATTAADKITAAPPVATTTTQAKTMTTTSTTSTTTTITEPSTSTPSPSHSKDLDSISQEINSMSQDISLFTNLVLVILTLVLIMFVTILVLGYTVNSRKKREINSGF